MNLGYSQRASRWSTRRRRRGRCGCRARARPTRIVHCLNYQLWTGGVTDHMIIEAAGATVVPFGVGQTRSAGDHPRARRERASMHPVVSGAPREGAARGDCPRAAHLGLRIGLFGGEAGLDNAASGRASRRRGGSRSATRTSGCRRCMSILGSSASTRPISTSTRADGVFAELLDPATLERLPIARGLDGRAGLHASRQASASRSCATGARQLTVTGTGPCACGRATWRFRIDRSHRRHVQRARRQRLPDRRAARWWRGCRSSLSGHLRIDLARARAVRPDRAARRGRRGAAGVAVRGGEGRARRALDRAPSAPVADVTIVAYEALGRTAHKTSYVERHP